MSILSIIIIILSMFCGVIYHEYGHMRAAKKYNIPVSQFVVGFGKPFATKKSEDGTEYGVAPLPLGGYCVIDADKLNKASLDVFTKISLAGVLRNFVLGTVMIAVGKLCIMRGVVDFHVLLNAVYQCIYALFAYLNSFIDNMFNFNQIASQGGVVTQIGQAGEILADVSVLNTIGSTLIMGGILNYSLCLLNILPIPGFDGGQIITRYICVGCKKFFNVNVKVWIQLQ